MEIVKLTPAYKSIIWGGNKLKSEYGKKTDLSPLAESWELAFHKDGKSLLPNGRALSDVVGEEDLGANCKGFPFFPVLVKFIDAQDKLSVQVHPADEYALKHENSLGKTEMWYIIDAKPGAKLVYGLKKGCTVDTLRKAIENGSVEEQLNFVDVKKGDVFFIPSGLVHAIGAGILLAEIQQNSNITYRVYDYNRLGKDGKPRELHVKDALNVIVNRTDDEIDKIRFSTNVKNDNTLASCEYFNVEKHFIDGDLEFSTNAESFNSILCLDGNGKIEYNGESFSLVKGDSYFIPAGLGEYTVSGKVEIIVSRI
jgi:mannose-6-phosphate isomerase